MGGRRGLIIILEGHVGWGWMNFATELGKVVAVFDSSTSKITVVPPKVDPGDIGFS
jgi:hypothetical protein